MINLNIRGMNEVNDKVSKAMKLYPQEARKAMELSCITVENKAKHLVPVDTGRLKSSITYKVSQSVYDITGTIGTDVEYAPYVELGTSRMNAQPFLVPALYGSKAEIKKIFEDVLNGIKL